jgi:hypothetical protein
MTPAPNTKIKLNELNKILNEMKQGEAAVKRLAEIDSSRGLQDPADVARRMRGNQNTPAIQASSNDVLGDNAIANNLRTQAEKMAAEAKGLLAESARMMKEAASMDGISPESVSTASITAPTEKRGRGRPAKAKVVA